MRPTQKLLAPLAAFAVALPLAASAISPAAATPAAQPVPVATADTEINIIGGNVERNIRPWLGRLSVSCGASVIAEQWLVTAAHCLKAGNATPTMTVRLGSLDKWSGGQVLDAAKEFPHPDYPNNAGRNKRYDIGLVKLKQRYTGGHVELANQRYDDGTRTRILGWGATQENSDGTLKMPKVLHGLDTKVVPDNECSTATGVFMPGYEYCTDNPRGTAGACYGDSGGPQITTIGGRDILLGVTSRGGKNCGTSPSVYTDVHAYKTWILNTVKREDGTLPPELAAWGSAPVKPTPVKPTPVKPTPVKPTPEPNDDEFADTTTYTLDDYRTVTSTVQSTYPNANKVTIALDVTHSCGQQLAIALTTPDGRRNTLKRSQYSRNCAAWQGTKSDTYTMRSASQGPWKLQVSDDYRGHTGTLNSWSVKFAK